MQKKIKIMEKVFLSTVLLTTIGFSKTFTVSNVSEFRQALEDSALNGEDDTINLNKGIYKTTSDGLGSFEFSDTEENSLTIKASHGLDNSDVILDGDNKDRVFNYINENSKGFYLQNLTIKNGNAHTFLGSGGGVLTNAEYSFIDKCIFLNNKSSFHGGGIATDQSTRLLIDKTIFEKNIAGSGYGGGAFYASIITNSVFSKNNSGAYTEIYQGANIIINSTFDNQKDTAVYGYNKVINSIFSNNKNDFEARYTTYLYNNYINYSKIISNNESIIKKNNINSLTIGDIKYIDNTLRLSSSSPAIKKGMDINTTEFKKLILGKDNISAENLSLRDKKIIEAINKLSFDKALNRRNITPDLGAYQYDETVKPEDDNSPTNEQEDTTSTKTPTGGGGGSTDYIFPLFVFFLILYRNRKKYLLLVK